MTIDRIMDKLEEFILESEQVEDDLEAMADYVKHLKELYTKGELYE